MVYPDFDRPLPNLRHFTRRPDSRCTVSGQKNTQSASLGGSGPARQAGHQLSIR